MSVRVDLKVTDLAMRGQLHALHEIAVETHRAFHVFERNIFAAALHGHVGTHL